MGIRLKKFNMKVRKDNTQEFEDVGLLGSDVEGDIEAIKESSIRHYDTVAQLKADSSLKEGMYVQTGGYYSINDGGGAYYKIYDTTPSSYYEVTNSGLYARLICDDFNVKKFGAYGDNSHNDTIAVTNAINAAGQFGGGIVLFPCGTYVLNPINIDKSYITLRGESMKNSVLSFNSDTDCIGYGVNYWYGRVENLNIINTGFGYCVSLKAPDNVVDKCEIVCAHHGVELGGVRGMLLNSNVIITGTEEDNVAVMVSSGDASSMIHNCLLKGNSGQGRGIFIKGGNAATTISHTSILLMYAGIFLDLESDNIFSLKIDVCFIDNCNISVQLSGDHTLYRTIMQASWFGSCNRVFSTYKTAKMDGLIFTNNEVSIVTYDALNIRGYDDIKIINNMFNRCAAVLIAMNGNTTDVVIKGNTFNGYADSDSTEGIAIYCDAQPKNCVIKDNDFTHVNTAFGGSPSADQFRGVIKDNISFKTENAGVETITAATTSINHGLNVVPDVILVSDGYTVSNINWNTFDVTGNSGTCRWYAFKSYQM